MGKIFPCGFFFGVFLFILTVFYFDASLVDNVFLTYRLINFVGKISQKANNVSVYVYMFKTNEEVSINDQVTYMPASLIKVPIMIAYLKQAQKHPAILQKKLQFPETMEDGFSQNIPPIKSIKHGEWYTIDDVLSYMIKYSDNNAADLLIMHDTNKLTEGVFASLGINSPNYSDIFYTISVKDYAKFFKALYEASYLNPSLSKKALSLLSHSEYTKGLVAGVPKNIVVAHKFGERAMDTPRMVRQYHECGIVFYSPNPYLLCVMTDGFDIYDQAHIVQQISSFVYKKISKS